MKLTRQLHCILLILVASQAMPLLTAAAQPKKLKVFVLAGQSNMEGHAKIETFDYIGDDPATAPLLQQMCGADGKPRVCDHVWISYFTGAPDGSANGEGTGKLTAGFGARRNPAEDGGKIGPEFTFGLTMDSALQEPVLLIKTAWGGKSLFYDFRPPSAGVYPRTADDFAKRRNPESGSGHFYRLMVEQVKKVLADPKRVCPAYDAAAGYEIAGFVWLQGWNDMVDRERGSPIVLCGEARTRKQRSLTLPCPNSSSCELQPHRWQPTTARRSTYASLPFLVLTTRPIQAVSLISAPT